MIESVIVAELEAIPELRGNIYPLNAPEHTPLPFCVYMPSGTNEDDSLSGWIGSYETGMEINIIHKSYTSMKSLSSKVVDKLKRMDSATVFIEENQPEIFEMEIDAYRKIINLRIAY